MATISEVHPTATVQQNLRRPDSTWAFDMTSALLALWFVIGLFVDGWAHNHGQTDNTFFTPWHALLYSGVLAVGLHLTWAQTRNMLRGYAWSRSLPKGYGLSLFGVGLFFAAGAVDLGWHTLFGFEPSIEALLSPPHLVLATAGICFIMGPLRSRWSAAQANPAQTGWSTSWRQALPTVFSAAMFYLMINFFTMYFNPYGVIDELTQAGGGRASQTSAIGGFLVHGAVLTGLVLFLIKRRPLPFGALTVIFSAGALGMMGLFLQYVSQYWQVLLAAPLAGLGLDLIVAWLKPTPERQWTYRVTATLIPVTLYTIFWAITALVFRTWWSVHMVGGIIFMSGVAGLLLSYLVVPPPDEVAA